MKDLELLKRRQDELRTEIMDLQVEMDRSTMTMKKYEDRKHRYRCLKNDLALAEKELASIKDRLTKQPATAEEAHEWARYKEMEEQLEKQQMVLSKEIASIQVELQAMAEEMKSEERQKHFDKRIALANIRELLKTADVKLGQIEKESGNNAGYMSRLEKEGNTSDPSVEFLVTAAEMLGVTLDELVKAKVGGMTPTEEYLMPFINGLIDDTKTEEILWDRQTASLFTNNYMVPETFKHPLMGSWYEEDDDGEPCQTGYGYVSKFFPNRGIEPSGNVYHGNLPEGETIYIAKCKKGYDSFTWGKDEFYEVYLVTAGMTSNVVSTLQAGEAVSAAVAKLYKEIEIASSHVRVEVMAKAAIDRYLKNKR